VAAHSLVSYLGKMIVPVKLLPFYPYPKSISLFSLEFFPALVLAIGITAVCIVRAKKQKIWLALWGYYVVTLVPVLGIVQVGTQAMADRYSYLPGLGPSLLTGLLTAWAYEKVNTLRKGERVVSLLSATAVLLMVASMIYLTIRQIEIWKNDLSMWDHIIYKEPEGVSMAYYNRCKLRQEMHQLDKALEDCNKAIALNRFSDEAYNVRGNVLEQLGQFDSALADYKTAIALNPLSFGAHYNRGILLNKLGKADRALEDYTRAIILNPLYYEAYVNRGNVLAMMGQGDGAIADYDKAISVNPYRFEAYMNRAILFLKMGQRERGISDLTTACNSGSKKACDALQVLLYPTGATEDGNYR
jgi:tetratricopeptide (TPR) repeat protein